MARRLLAAVVLACALIASAGAGDADARAKRRSQCADTHVRPAPGNLAVVRAAVLCLHNRERAARGLPVLTEHPKLRQAAARHSERMVEDRFFSHVTPSGADMAERILRTGYAGRGGWALGENLAWGTGERATAAEIQRAWMDSPGHRANILRREFREIGIGISLGIPVARGRDGGATFTADFGVRR